MSDEEQPAIAVEQLAVPAMAEQLAAPAMPAQARVNASATFSINPPESFDFSKPQDWEKWIRRFERFRVASDLDKSSDANQVNTLIYCMGDEADDVLRGLRITEEEKLVYSSVKVGFTNFFVPKKNVIYQRAKFNMRVQGATESADSFITALYALAEDCGYGALREELLRDRIVVGIRDSALSQKMQMERKLDLAKAINMVRQAEDIKRQQTDIRGEPSHASKATVDAVHSDRGRKPAWRGKKPPATQTMDKHDTHGAGQSCQNCGKAPFHTKFNCPAKNADCHNCGKRGHYSKVCKSAKRVSAVSEDTDTEEDIFLFTVDAGKQAWTVDLKIRDTNVTFKIDTGADVTVIPEQVYRQICGGACSSLAPGNKALFGPGHMPLSVVGVAREELHCGNKHTTEDMYIIKGLNTALLSRPASVNLRLVARIDSIDMDSVKQTYPKLCTGLGLVQQPHTIKLKPDAKPVSLKVPRRVPLPLMGKVKQELQRMEKLGVISRIEEPTEWCSGMVVAPKKNKDEVRICVDLTPLNQAVRREKFILPSVDQTLGMLSGAKFFSKIDANMGFWQIPLTKDCAHYTTFITPFGRYFFNRLPFGISSAPEHFQNRMVKVTEGLEGVVCHMDDVLIWGSTQAEHDARVHAVLQRAQEAGITLNTGKCEFSRTTVKFLGYVISPEGVTPDPEKTCAVREMDPPRNISELRSFLGMVNQLGKFLPNLAEKDKALRDLLSKKNQWYWGPEQSKAFTSLKEELSSTPVLQLYDPNKNLKISADASSYGLGGVLLQEQQDTWAPVAYASRALTSTEQRYAQVEKEALALTWACERFSDFVIGLHFELETDHKPLVSLLGGQALDTLPPRIQRFRMRLMRYRYTITHVPGKSLTTADTLSRAPLQSGGVTERDGLLEETNIYVDCVLANLPASEAYLSDLRRQLSADSICSEVMRHCAEGWPDCSRLDALVRPYWAERAVLSTHNGLLLRGTRLVIPSVMRNSVLEKIHEGHQGIVKCRERAKQSVWWPGLSSQIEELVLKCNACVEKRANPAEPLMPTKLPDRPWQKLGADLFTLKNTNYLLVVDYFSRYTEVAQLSPTRCADVIVHLKSMFARHGIPETLVSDNGPQFSGAQMAAFATEYEFQHVTSSPRYPQSNGEAERAVQTIKNLLKKAPDPYRALLAYRSTPLSNGFSPAQLLMGRRLRTTVPSFPAMLEPAIPDLRAVQSKERERRWMDASNFDHRHRVRNLPHLSPGDRVWITDSKTPGTVTSAHDTPRSYLISGPQGTIRRNRRHLLPMASDNGDNTQHQAAKADPPDTARDTGTVSTEGSQGSPPIIRTRSGRPVIKPERLDL